MAKPGFKKRGGFLNGQDATLLGVKFSERATEKGNWLFAGVQVQADGAEPTALFDMFCGSADFFTIGDDGLTLVPVSEDNQLSSDELERFLAELETAGYPASGIAQVWGRTLEDPIDFRPIAGTRVHFVQVDDPEKTKELGQRRGTDGKMYNRTRPKVTQVLSLPTIKAAAKQAVKAVPAKKVNGKAADTELREVAEGILVTIVTNNNGTIQKSRLPVAVSRAVDKNDPNRRALQDLIYSAEFIDSAVSSCLIEYDAKTQTISLA